MVGKCFNTGNLKEVIICGKKKKMSSATLSTSTPVGSQEEKNVTKEKRVELTPSATSEASSTSTPDGSQYATVGNCAFGGESTFDEKKKKEDDTKELRDKAKRVRRLLDTRSIMDPNDWIIKLYDVPRVEMEYVERWRARAGSKTLQRALTFNKLGIDAVTIRKGDTFEIVVYVPTFSSRTLQPPTRLFDLSGNEA